jgi:hypothetical protein
MISTIVLEMVPMPAITNKKMPSTFTMRGR